MGRGCSAAPFSSDTGLTLGDSPNDVLRRAPIILGTQKGPRLRGVTTCRFAGSCQ